MRFDRKQFFDGFRPWYRSVTGDALDQEKVDALEFLLTSFENDATWTRPEEVAGAIANIHVETFVPKANDRYSPIREFGGKAYFIRQYWNDLKIRKQLGNESQDDAWRRCGRGYAQETGLANDVKMTHLTGVDLVNDPDAAMVPENAFKILTAGMFHGVWTGKKIGDFINDNDCDYYNLRTVINGHDRASEIAGYAHALAKILSDALLANAPAADLAVQPTDSGTPIDKPADLNPDGTPTVDPPPANPGDVVVEKETNVGFFKGIWKELTGWAAVHGGLATLQGYKEQIDSFGLPGWIIAYAMVAAFAAFVLWFLYRAVMHIWQGISKRWLTTSLIQANATPTNTVTVACPDDLAKYQAAGYTVVTRQ